MILGHFIRKKGVQVEYRPSEFVDFHDAIVSFAFTLEHLDPNHWSTKQRLATRLYMSVLHNLSQRLNAKKLYQGQKKVKFTFTHTEALALICFCTSTSLDATGSSRHAMIVQYTINQLHKHYA